MKIVINLAMFDPLVCYPELSSRTLQCKAFAVYEEANRFEGIVVISKDNNCKFPFDLLTTEIKVKVVSGSSSGSLRFDYRQAWIIFWDNNSFDGLAKDRLLVEAKVVVAEDGQFLKGTPETLKKYMIKLQRR